MRAACGSRAMLALCFAFACAFAFGAHDAFDREPPPAWPYSGRHSFLPDYDVPGRCFHASCRHES